MSVKKSPSAFEKIFVKVPMVVFFLLLGSVLFVTYKILHHSNIRPINSSQTYYQDAFRNVYKDITGGCLDICFEKKFKKLRVDKNTFTVLMVQNPFTPSKRERQPLASNYAKDKAQVFYAYEEEKILGADPSSFRAISFNLGKDNNQYFFEGKPLHRYITEEINPTHEFTPETLDVVSYGLVVRVGDEDLVDYLVLKADAHYYYVKLNPQPRTIEEITSTSASRFPKLQ